MKMPAVALRAKRLVIESEGIMTIIGEHEGEIPVIITFPVETTQNEENPSGVKLHTVSLIKVRPRYALYREIQAPPSSTFNESFHPAQV